MKAKLLTAFVLVMLLCTAQEAGSWGFWAHQQINRVAVFTLPEELFAFYRHQLDYLTKHAVDPDKRRTSDPEEAPRHYIDLDYYGPYPYDSLPRRWLDAVERYTEDTLKAYGIVPWHVQRMYYRLVNAFRDKDADRILRLSAEIGHYIADAHVPLHATLNYNGQLTGQHGIHSLLESRIPELFHEQYDFVVGRTQLFDNPLDRIWEVVLQSGAAVDTVLAMEMQVRAEIPEEERHVLESRGNRQIKVYSREYAARYHELLNGMVERRMRQSILAVGAFWYTAWAEAGQPDLSSLSPNKLSEADSTELAKETSRYRSGLFLGRPEAE
ncbi:MAG: zinc dependent phospholipase C family protein [Bacteroidia bacterium]